MKASEQLHQPWPARKTRKFQSLLLEWYAGHKRALPWRAHPDPYRVWISEIMLQQTQVRTALPYYRRFISRFPDVGKLAAASESEVLVLWAGLGYYSRARYLHAAARIIVEEHRGRFPDTLAEILRLPGVGRYTAGAILSIAFNQPQPIVDGNVRRVISRLRGIEGLVPDSLVWEQARSWIPDGRASDFNQAVMELGALVCIPAGPLCPECPVRRLCRARKEGIQERIPPPRKLRATESVRLVMVILESHGCIALVRRSDALFIPGEWGLPLQAVSDGASPSDVAVRLARKTLRRKVALHRCRMVRHTVTYRRIMIEVYYGKVASRVKARSRDRDLRWISKSEIRRELTSSAFLKALEPVKSTDH